MSDMRRDRSEVEPQPIAIIGIACIFPGADDREAYWANIREGVDSISEVPETHWRIADYFDSDPSTPDHTYARRGGFLQQIAFDPLEFGIAPRDVEATDTSQLLGLVAAKRALADAGYGPDGRPFDRDRTSVVLGVTGALELVIPLGARLGHPIWREALREAGVEQQTADRVVERIAAGYVDWQENSFPGLLGNVVAGRIANRLDLHGTNCVVDAACASSLSAIHLASLELQSGSAEMAISGGIDTFNDIFMYMCFSKTPALSPRGEARPFDRSADGTALGEGIGLVVLKRLADARRDGDRIYAVIRSIGCASDGGGTAIYAPNADGQARAVRRAYAAAGVSPETIELVEAHGTGTKVGDATEVRGLTQVFGEGASPATEPHCALGSVKGNIGHTKAAAGAAGLIKAALALRHQVLPPTIKVESPTKALSGTPLYVNTEKRPWIASAEHPRRAAVSAFGFGGSNFHCVVEEDDPEGERFDWDGQVQLLALSGADPAALIRSLEDLPIQSASALRAAAGDSRRAFDPAQPCRLVIVLPLNQDSARERIAQATAGLRDPEQTRWGMRDLFFGRGRAPGALAALFPGQGAQYAGMLRDLACSFSEFRQMLTRANRVLAKRMGPLSEQIYPRPVFDDDQRVAAEAALTATDVAQPALGAVSLAAWRVLSHFGLQVSAAAGHSYGELVALCAAGRMSPDELFRLSRLRGELMAAPRADRGTMLAAIGKLDDLEQLIAKHRLNLVLANRNSPKQVVLSGPTAEIERARELLAAPRRVLKPLAVAAAFHSPLVADARAPFEDALSAVQLGRPGDFAVYANTTATPYPNDDAAARKLLAGQLAAPVDFVGCIEAMAARGISDFVEIGPGGRLARLTGEILRDPNSLQVSVDASSTSGRGMLDLARTLAALAARGHHVQLDRWDPDYRAPNASTSKSKLLIPLCGANYVAPERRAKAKRSAPPQHDNTPASAAPSATTTSPHGPAPSFAPHPAATAGLHNQALGSAPRQATTNAAPPRPNRVAEVRSVSAMTKPDGSKPSAGDPTLLSEALRATETSMQALVQLQSQTAELHRQFLAGQEQATRSFEALVQRQQEMFASQIGISPATPTYAPAASPSPVGGPAMAHHPQPAAAAVRATGPELHATDAPMLSTPQPAPTAVAGVDPGQAGAAEAPSSSPLPAEPTGAASAAPARSGASQITDALLAVVSEKTGYPSEMLELSMDLHGDLGIDSIKRVEILGGLQERLPEAPQIGAEHLGRLRTLGQIVDFLSDDGPPPDPTMPLAEEARRHRGPMATPDARTEARTRVTEARTRATAGQPRATARRRAAQARARATRTPRRARATTTPRPARARATTTPRPARARAPRPRAAGGSTAMCRSFSRRAPRVPRSSCPRRRVFGSAAPRTVSPKRSSPSCVRGATRQSKSSAGPPTEFRATSAVCF
jgi:polyketide-type polyunsaturated fatty acid synthase PfaA